MQPFKLLRSLEQHVFCSLSLSSSKVQHAAMRMLQSSAAELTGWTPFESGCELQVKILTSGGCRNILEKVCALAASGQAFSSYYLMKGSCPNPVFSNHEVVVVQSGANAVWRLFTILSYVCKWLGEFNMLPFNDFQHAEVAMTQNVPGTVWSTSCQNSIQDH